MDGQPELEGIFKTWARGIVFNTMVVEGVGVIKLLRPK